MDKEKRRARFLRDPLSIRLGGIASNCLRLESFADDPRHSDIIASVLRENKLFCEWAGLEAAATDIEIAQTLLTLQRQLVRWEHRIHSIFSDPVSRADMATTARAWSDHLLMRSGLLETGWENTRKAAHESTQAH